MTSPSNPYRKAERQLIDWLRRRSTPDDAWYTLRLEDIAKRAGVSKSSVTRHLNIAVSRVKGISIETVKQRRKAERKGKAERQLIAWLKRGSTPDDVWYTLRLEDIAKRAEVGISSLSENLNTAVAEVTGLSVEAVKQRRLEEYAKARGRMTGEKLEKLQELLSKENPASTEECALELDLSTETIRKYRKQLGI